MGLPTVVNLFGNKQARAEEWIRSPLLDLGTWGKTCMNRLYAANFDAAPIEIGDLVEDEFEPGLGWFPLELPLRVLKAYAEDGMTVWDGFCGRGTVGKACQMLGMTYIGIDRDPARIVLAREYLGC